MSVRSIALPIAAIALALTACAGPRYQTVQRYEPPADAAGRACLDRCREQQTFCQGRCSDDYQACMRRVEPLVQERYADALKEYGAELDRYWWDLRHYEMQLWQYRGRPNPWYAPWPNYYWPGPYAYPYPQPLRPSRQALLNEIRLEHCNRDCGCTGDYDACFLTCGGRKVTETRCIANCPDDAK